MATSRRTRASVPRRPRAVVAHASRVLRRHSRRPLGSLDPHAVFLSSSVFHVLESPLLDSDLSSGGPISPLWYDRHVRHRRPSRAAGRGFIGCRSLEAQGEAPRALPKPAPRETRARRGGQSQETRQRR